MIPANGLRDMPWLTRISAASHNNFPHAILFGYSENFLYGVPKIRQANHLVLWRSMDEFKPFLKSIRRHGQPRFALRNRFNMQQNYSRSPMRRLLISNFQRFF